MNRFWLEPIHPKLNRCRGKERATTSASTVTGTVDQVLPRAMYRVTLEDGRKVRAGLATSSKHSMVRLIEGDRVQLRLSATDPSRGQITRKL